MIPSSCQSSAAQKSQQDDRYVRTRAHCQFISKVDKYILKKHNLVLSGEGCTSDLDTNTTRKTFFNFSSKDELTIDQIRKLSVQLVLEILKLHLEDFDYKPFLYEFPFNIKNVGLRILTPINTPEKLAYWPNIKIVSFRKRHFYYEFYKLSTSSKDKIVCDHGYNETNGEHEESFRWALNEVKDDIPLELLGVAAKLGLLDGNLKDEYRDGETEADEETQTKEFEIRHLKSLQKRGFISKDDLEKRTEEISREN